MKLKKEKLEQIEEILIKMVGDIYNGIGGNVDDRMKDIEDVLKDIKVCSCKTKKDK